MTWSDLFGTSAVVVDGGLSTQLERRGHDVAGPLWTGRVLLTDPGAVTGAHEDFVRAGADVVITASYQVSRAGFAEAGLAAAAADDALVASVQAARAATTGTSVRVAASVGPYGAILHDGSEYRGNYGLSTARLAEFHAERLAVLAAAGPDLLAVETIPDVQEAEALVEVLAGHPGIPAWLTFSAADDRTVCAGQAIEEAVAVAASCPQVVAVGVNCTDPRHVRGLVARIGAVTDLPVVVYPNAGGSWDPSSGTWSDVADPAAAFDPGIVQAWRSAGAAAIGGCCGTDARSVAVIARTLRGPAA